MCQAAIKRHQQEGKKWIIDLKNDFRKAIKFVDFLFSDLYCHNRASSSSSSAAAAAAAAAAAIAAVVVVGVGGVVIIKRGGGRRRRRKRNKMQPTNLSSGKIKYKSNNKEFIL